jgi:H+-transporting ATPase
MPPLGWKWAGFVWAYALVWALVSDRVKLLAYRVLDPVKPSSVNQGNAQAKTEDQDAEAKASAHLAQK